MPRKKAGPWLYYSQTARGYDELHGAEQRRKVQFIISLLKPKKMWNVIDIGCGTGISMEGWPCRIEGVEPSREMAKAARSKGLKVWITPAEKLPFQENAFDLSISITSAHHFKKKAFQEIARVSPRAVFSVLAKTAKQIKNLLEPFWILEESHRFPPDIIFICRRR